MQQGVTGLGHRFGVELDAGAGALRAGILLPARKSLSTPSTSLTPYGFGGGLRGVPFPYHMKLLAEGTSCQPLPVVRKLRFRNSHGPITSLLEVADATS